MGRVSEAALGATAIGSLLHFALVSLGLGLGSGTQILIARKAGEKKDAEIGQIYDHSIYLTVAIALFASILLYFSSPFLLHFLLKSHEIFSLSCDYIKYRSLGTVLTFLAISYRGFYSGIGKTKIISTGVWIMSLLNVLLDYLFIFGHWGLPEMGIKGAALASNLAELIAVLYLIYCSTAKGRGVQYQLYTFVKPRLEVFQHIIQLALPIMAQFAVSLIAWFLFFVAIEQLGETQLAISNILRSLYMLLMTPIWGYGTATTTVVSNLIGQDKKYQVNVAVKRSLIISMATSTAIGLSVVLFPRQILGFFTGDVLIIEQSVASLYVIMSSMLLFAAAVSLISAVAGTGDTKAAMLIEISAIAVYVVYLIVVCFWIPQPLPIVWMAEYVYWILQLNLSYFRLKSAKWKFLPIQKEI